jgi:hypothetical protein
MAKVKKMADGGMTSLGALAAGAMPPAYKSRPTDATAVPGGGGGGGGSASDGLGQINQGAGTVATAISRASDALGGGGGGLMGGGGKGGLGPDVPDFAMTTYAKKGGSIKKHSSGGKINLNECRVSTTPKGKTNSNW